MNKEEFKQKRKELGLKTRGLANELGLSPKNGDVYIRKIESGASEPSGLLIRCFELFCERENKQENQLKLINNNSYDFVPTIGGRGQRHPHNLVGKVWKIKDPETISMGSSFFKGRLKEGDLVFCKRHSGDCFQEYVFVEKINYFGVGEKYRLLESFTFGSYGIGDAQEVEGITAETIEEIRGQIDIKQGIKDLVD